MLNKKQWMHLLDKLYYNPFMLVYQHNGRLYFCPDKWYTLICDVEDNLLQVDALSPILQGLEDIINQASDEVCQPTGIRIDRIDERKIDPVSKLCNQAGVVSYIQDKLLKLYPESQYRYYSDGGPKPIYIYSKTDGEPCAIIMPYKI